MKHYGDITKLSGYTLPVVDCITGGSPCQDLSVAGKREGLSGKRSGLFMEQIRIIKEMRERDRANGRSGFMVRPRYCVWENVPGAFSSNGGKDFQAVLTEFVKVSAPEADDVPLPENGKWPKSGCIYAEMGGWSIAWRVHDAQFWGVPQRRKRIALVADFGGLSAPEILFERKGLSGDSEPCGTAREETAGAVGGGAYPTVARSLTQRYDGSPCVDRGPNIVMQSAEPILLESNQNHATVQTDGISTALPASMGMGGGYVPMVTAYGISAYDSNAMKSPNPHSGIYEADTARTLDLNGGSPACNQGGMAILQNQEPIPINTMVATRDTTENRTTFGVGEPGEPQFTISAAHEHAVFCAGFSFGQSEKARSIGYQDEISPTLRGGEGGNQKPCVFDARGNGNGGTSLNLNNICRQAHVVRRLTPLECERLQGFPDKWTDIGDWVDSQGKKHKAADSPRYKALGNSIALPFWQYLARRICAQYERDITMGSLFDGIGGFPLVFERCGAKAIWASEIEEFPIAVTKKHFPEETQ